MSNQKYKLGNKGRTEEEAINAGMDREELDSDNKCNHCPECGCPWYGNKNLCGDCARVCFNCHQDWWIDISYDKQSPLTELTNPTL